MSKHFNYYDAWQSVELECPTCHWKGKFDEGSVGYFQELMDCSCPKCSFFVSPILAIVNYPTLDEMLASGIPADIERAKRIEQFQQKFDSMKLLRKDQLPEVNSTSFALAWDFIEADGERLTVIRHDDRVLFSEPALWEGYERFEQVCKIVREKYGVRVNDLVPTGDSEVYLYGDVLYSPTFVTAARREIFGSQEQLLPPRPQLQCPKCAFRNDNPEGLAEHLVEAHGYGISSAWFVAGQENERLYPRFKAPAGKFSALGVDKVQSRGGIIATCASLDEAIAAADQEAESYPEISVYDDSGNELYVVIPRSTEDKPKPNEKPDPKVWDKPRKAMIFLMPTYKPKKPSKPS